MIISLAYVEEFHYLLPAYPTFLLADPDPLSLSQEFPQPCFSYNAIDRLPTIIVSLAVWPCQYFGSTINGGKLSNTESYKFASRSAAREESGCGASLFGSILQINKLVPQSKFKSDFIRAS